MGRRAATRAPRLPRDSETFIARAPLMHPWLRVEFTLHGCHCHDQRRQQRCPRCHGVLLLEAKND